ncbi:MAG TPA: hypothetical protein VFH06_01150 [Candidatus Saccharimonadales bacterium]|nr:hypothetical protein [Candidatus Saccharimonadales bacterium]
MVELRKAFLPGSISGRKILLFATSMLVAVFALLGISPTAYAADATWQGNSITYAQKQYIKTGNAGSNDPRGFAKDTQIYAYVEPIVSGSSNPTQKAHLIYFAPGTDPTKATTASYVVYDYTPPDSYTNPSGATQITLDPQPANANENTTSCALEGIGWIVCPVTKFLAGAMDWMYGILASFLTVRPVQTSQDNSLFRIWAVMRNFANIVFVIGFLVIIYSQITNAGISNYGIKRLLPRLIAAAILVNLSYWICAIAIDVSNILGNSIQELFISLRNVLVGREGNNWDIISWESISSFILSGGTAAVLAGIGANILLGGTITGSIFMLVPVLVTVLVAVLVALLVMALRQALITILVIVSPLAFVAYLLPNTEKYFEKWRELFMTMLLLFPIFSVIFGGSQLAGMAIIQNANSINLILLGMAVQVAPIIITPLLIKFSGSLLGRFAGMVNNPNKGLIDRTRNWAKDRAENQKARVLAGTPRAGWRGAATRRSQNIETKRRKREGWRAANTALADAAWANSEEYSKIHQANQRAALSKEAGETAAQVRFETAKTTNAALQHMDVEARAAKLNLDVTKAKVDANWQELMAGKRTNENLLDLEALNPAEVSRRGIGNYQAYRNNMVEAIKQASIDNNLEKRRAHSAEHVRQEDMTKLMLSDNLIRERAKGIDPHGADTALANAVAEDRTAFGKSVEEAKHVLKHFNVSAEKRADLLRGETIHVTDSSGHPRDFSLKDTFITEAAIEIQMKEGSFRQREDIIAESGKGGKLYAHRTTIGDEAKANKIGEMAAYFGGSAIDRIKQGEIKGNAGIDLNIAHTIRSGKLKAAHLADMDWEAVQRVVKVARANAPAEFNAAQVAEYERNRAQLGTLAKEALTNTSLRGRVARNSLEHLQNLIQDFPPPPTPPNNP